VNDCGKARYTKNQFKVECKIHLSLSCFEHHASRFWFITQLSYLALDRGILRIRSLSLKK
jgi:hypothetical protein